LSLVEAFRPMIFAEAVALVIRQASPETVTGQLTLTTANLPDVGTLTVFRVTFATVA
jgi:hypothetical protein